MLNSNVISWIKLAKPEVEFWSVDGIKYTVSDLFSSEFHYLMIFFLANFQSLLGAMLAYDVSYKVEIFGLILLKADS